VKLTKRVFLWLGIAVITFGLVGCSALFGSNQYLVKRVSDGDTLAVTNTRGADFTVRFSCVDAPEVPHSTKERNTKKASARDQFKWGVKAQARVKQLVEQGGDRVTLTITDSDRYGRKVSEVRLRDGTLIQEVLTREGLALVYRPYLKNCPSAALVERAEVEAKQQRRGVWSDSKFVEPWEYRRGRHPARPNYSQRSYDSRKLVGDR
jgi:endonuclease YncB( thermonuclease family)